MHCSPPGPSKSPFSELVGVRHSFTEEVEKIVDGLEATVGEIHAAPRVYPPQVAHFELGKDGLRTRPKLKDIADLTWDLWERRGRPFGMPEVDWFEANDD